VAGYFITRTGDLHTNGDFRDPLDQHGVLCSMSARGHCYGKAPVENFFGVLKREQARRRIHATRAEATADRFNDIEVFNNRKNRHATLEYPSPVQFENRTIRAEPTGPKHRARTTVPISGNDQTSF
jgi:putative transposase